MKGIFVILDGISDLPSLKLDGKTPLEVAKTPNLDFLARSSKLDYCYTVKEGVAPQSHSALISLFGQDPNLAPRGPLEAMGADIKITNGDLALRTNFATIDDLENLNIIDKRAGRTLTTKEAKKLAQAINSQVKLSHNYKFEFFPTVHYRGVLVIRGGFSDNITNTDPSYGRGFTVLNPKTKVQWSHPMDDEDDSQLSAELINSFVRQSFKVLDEHPINQKRARGGLYAANILLCRDAGNHPVKFKKLKGKWAAVCYMPLEIGIAKAFNMAVFKYKPPKLKKIDFYSHLHKTLQGYTKFCIKQLKKNHKKHDCFYIHFKETDTPGHDNLPHEKIKMIEFLDETFFKFIKEFIKNNKLIITADHTTACKLKAHTADPVPVLTYPYHGPKKLNPKRRFTEKFSREGRKILGRKLLEENFF